MKLEFSCVNINEKTPNSEVEDKTTHSTSIYNDKNTIVITYKKVINKIKWKIINHNFLFLF